MLTKLINLAKAMKNKSIALIVISLFILIFLGILGSFGSGFMVLGHIFRWEIFSSSLAKVFTVASNEDLVKNKTSYYVIFYYGIYSSFFLSIAYIVLGLNLLKIKEWARKFLVYVAS